MTIVAHKYMPEEIPEIELERTFAARGHTLEYLASALRQQIHTATPSSFLITGPRGPGKSTIIRMLRIRIRKDPELNAALLPVAFPEEQFNVASLRDLLAATLGRLADQGIASAAQWFRKVEAEDDDEQSQELAVTALREISHETGKRLVLFIENFDAFCDHSLQEPSRAALRRFLMDEPFMMIVGSAVHMLESLQKYDNALFNYFCPVPLDRLNEDEVFELLQLRAEFDRNERFLRVFRQNRPRIRAIAHLSGGNPRLILMLYELLSQQRVTTVVQQLRRLVDELTPLLKHQLESLPDQQQKIVHALMERGGTASPKDLTAATRLSLNAVTMQLHRLKEAQILELRGGGKGRPAYYTVPDKLFAVWYQMRCLREQRRRIELFVEVLQVWFEAEERFTVLQSMVAGRDSLEPHVLRETAAAAEYFAASLRGTSFEDLAQGTALRQWVKCGELREAALAHAEFSQLETRDDRAYEALAYAGLGNWGLAHEDPQTALAALSESIKSNPTPMTMLSYGLALGLSGRHPEAVKAFDSVVESQPSDITLLARGLVIRGVTKRMAGDTQGATADWTRVIELPDGPPEGVASALVTRGVAKGMAGDTQGAIADYTAVVELADAPKDHIANALFNRGVTKRMAGDTQGEIADYTAVIDLPDAALDVQIDTAERGFRMLLRAKDTARAFKMLERFVRALHRLTTAEKANALITWLERLAAPDMKQSWVEAYRLLTKEQAPEVMERLHFLEPVCVMLEGGDPSVLDSLPPEQREFAQKVLERFDERVEQKAPELLKPALT